MEENLLIIVTVDDAHLAHIHALSQQLQDLGMHVDAVMETIGVISGSVHPDGFDRLKDVEGVEQVEVQREYWAT